MKRNEQGAKKDKKIHQRESHQEMEAVKLGLQISNPAFEYPLDKASKVYHHADIIGDDQNGGECIPDLVGADFNFIILQNGVMELVVSNGIAQLGAQEAQWPVGRGQGKADAEHIPGTAI